MEALHGDSGLLETKTKTHKEHKRLSTRVFTDKCTEKTHRFNRAFGDSLHQEYLYTVLFFCVHVERQLKTQSNGRYNVTCNETEDGVKSIPSCDMRPVWAPVTPVNPATCRWLRELQSVCVCVCALHHCAAGGRLPACFERANFWKHASI